MRKHSISGLITKVTGSTGDELIFLAIFRAKGAFAESKYTLKIVEMYLKFGDSLMKCNRNDHLSLCSLTRAVHVTAFSYSQ